MPELRRTARTLVAFLGSDYARHARDQAATIRTRQRFLLGLPRAAHRPAVALDGDVDVEVTWRTGALDLLFFSGPEDQDLVLRAAAVARARPGAALRAGFITDGLEPRFLGDLGGPLHDTAAFSASVVALACRLASSRFVDRFDGISVHRCQRLECGFLDACHGHRGEPGLTQASDGEARSER